MKYFAQFLNRTADGWVEPCGSFAWVRFDGRLSLTNMHNIAEEECLKRGYDGWRIGRGERLDRLFWLNDAVYPLTQREPAE